MSFLINAPNQCEIRSQLPIEMGVAPVNSTLHSIEIKDSAMPPTIAKFLTGADAIQLFVSLATQSVPADQSDRPLAKPATHSTLIALPFVFSHTTFRLIEMLSITQHGEFLTSSRKGKFQTFVEVGGHVCQRQCLSDAELQAVQRLYQQIEAQLTRWRSQSQHL